MNTAAISKLIQVMPVLVMIFFMEVNIHNVSHVFQLRKYVGEDRLIPDMLEVQLGPNLYFEQKQVAIVDWKLKEFQNRIIPLVLVILDTRFSGEFTRE